MSALKNLILDADDLPTKELEIPEWGVTVTVKAMDGETRGRFAMSATDEDGNRDEQAYIQSSARLAAMVLVDPETKELIFTAEDVPALARKSAAALDRISQVAFSISGLTEDERSTVEATFHQ